MARNVQFNFAPDEYILCFEPDVTKARVLYNAKILQTVPYDDPENGQVPGYQIHFQGWNSSWDRIVPEMYILKNTHDNRQLMKRLADVARNIKQNKQRKKRIDVILRHHFNKRHLFDSETDTDNDGSSDDGSSGFQNGLDLNGIGQGSTESSSDSEISFDSNTGEDVQETEESKEELSDQTGSDEETVKREVHIEIPDVLKRVLEEDFVAIHKHGKLHKLPADPNVISILETYLRQFAVNVVCGPHERPRPRGEPFPPPVRSVEFCKEVIDGLRIMFDFTLSELLLYESERSQYSMSCTTPSKPHDRTDSSAEDSVFELSPTNDSSLSRLRSRGFNTADEAPKLAKCQIESESSDSESEEEIVCKRMTRHSYQEEIRRSLDGKDTPKETLKDSTQTPKNTPSKSSQQQCVSKAQRQQTKQNSGAGATHCATPRKRHHSPDLPSRSTRQSEGRSLRRESLRSAAIVGNLQQQTSESEKGSDDLSDRLTPPPPLLLPNTTDSHTNSPKQTPTRSRCSTPTLGDPMEKETCLEKVLLWKLVPDDLYNSNPKPPSLVYGATHLLRLFVRLPDLLSKMAFREDRLQTLIKHLNMFLEYFRELHKGMFQDSQYLDTKCEAD